MAQKYNTGDVAYIVESNRFLRKVVVTKYVGGSYIIKFKDTGGGIRVHESRLFQTEEEAEKRLGTDGKLGYEWLVKLPEIVGCDRVYLLLEENGMQAKYWIAECNPKVINWIINDTFTPSDYFIVDKKYKWMITENHHEVVQFIGCVFDGETIDKIVSC